MLWVVGIFWNFLEHKAIFKPVWLGAPSKHRFPDPSSRVFSLFHASLMDAELRQPPLRSLLSLILIVGLVHYCAWSPHANDWSFLIDYSSPPLVNDWIFGTTCSSALVEDKFLATSFSLQINVGLCIKCLAYSVSSTDSLLASKLAAIALGLHEDLSIDHFSFTDVATFPNLSSATSLIVLTDMTTPTGLTTALLMSSGLTELLWEDPKTTAALYICGLLHRLFIGSRCF